MLVLGIETSCDETAAAVVEDGRKVLSNVVASSVEFHRRFGGIVPEIACRKQVELVNFVVREALRRAKTDLAEIELIAVTRGPGLVGALLVGVSFAKALSFNRRIPLVGIDHRWAHLYANFFGQKIKFPFVGLLVSGGHTSLVYGRSFARFETLGETGDDACGEAFDKVAKILGLGYPGGPVIEKIAREGRPEKIKFPRSFLGKDSLDFSFSGLKTAVLYYLRDSGRPNRQEIADIAASFQEAVFEVLVFKSLLACQKKRIKRLLAGGGVIANQSLRSRLVRELGKRGIEVCFPHPAYCLDNGAMVAGLGYVQYRHKKGQAFAGQFAPLGDSLRR